MPDNNEERLCLLVCRHFLREAEAILQSGPYEDAFMQAYPPACSHPRLAPAGLDQINKTHQERGENVFLVGGCFLSSQKLLSQIPPDCGMLHLEQCFYLLANRGLIEEHLRSGAYLLTPHWLAEWPAQLAEWGFDQKADARTFFAESATRLVLLDTGLDQGSAGEMAKLAAYLDMPFEIVPVGLDYFRLLLTQIILEWRLKKNRLAKQAALDHVYWKLAEQGMALDLMGELTHMGTEAEAIEQILNLCTVLFAPRQVIYTSINNNRAEHVYASPSSPPPKTGDIETWLTRDPDAASWLETEGGFCLGLTHQKQPLGLLEIKEVAFPKYQRDYLNMAVLIARVCGLAIAKTRLFQEFRQLATTDPLTGLHNRRHFFSLASNEFSRTCRYNRPLAALMLDIDHFKKVNDSFGHAAGDRVLSEVAQCCREALRSTDINGRYGGEEFVFLLPETDQDAAQAFAERLRRTIADLPIALEGHALHITASLGLASQTNDCPSLEALLDRSDQALYAAKRSGRNRVCTWPDQIRAQKDSP